MGNKALKEALESISSGKDLPAIFIESGFSPSDIYFSLRDFLQNPDKRLLKKVAARHGFSQQYLIDRIEQLLTQIDEFRETNPYAHLGLTYQATSSEIRESWKRLISLWHPDKMGDKGQALDMSQKVNEAYRFLRSRTLRRDYDKENAVLLAIVKDIEESVRGSDVRKKRGFPLRAIGAGITLALSVTLVLYIGRGKEETRKAVPKHPPSSKRVAEKVKAGLPEKASKSQKKREVSRPEKKGKEVERLVASARSTQSKRHESRSSRLAGEHETKERGSLEYQDKKGSPESVSVVTKETVKTPEPEKEEKRKTKQATAGHAVKLVRQSPAPAKAGTPVKETKKESNPVSQKTGKKGESPLPHPSKVMAKGFPGVEDLSLAGIQGTKGPGRIVLGNGGQTFGARSESQTTGNGGMLTGRLILTHPPAMTGFHDKANANIQAPARVEHQAPDEVIDTFIRYYRDGDSSSLFSLFEENAVQNGVPVRLAIKNYDVLFKSLKVLRFDFVKEKVERHQGRCEISGRYDSEYRKVRGKEIFRDKGRLLFVLARSDGRKWRIKKLDFERGKE